MFLKLERIERDPLSEDRDLKLNELMDFIFDGIGWDCDLDLHRYVCSRGKLIGFPQTTNPCERPSVVLDTRAERTSLANSSQPHRDHVETHPVA
jgi:hypothetical protein